MKKVNKIYFAFLRSGFVKIEGSIYEVIFSECPDLVWIMHRSFKRVDFSKEPEQNQNWTIADPISGMALTDPLSTQKEAIEEAKRIFKDVGIKGVLNVLETGKRHAETYSGYELIKGLIGKEKDKE